MINSPDSTLAFCERWLLKAALYKTSRVEDVFDKFFTLFVAFNRLYVYAAQIARQPRARDRRMATRLFPEFVGHEPLWQAVIGDGGQADVNMLHRLIGPGGGFFLISAGDPDTPDLERSTDLHRRMANSSPCVAVEALLEFLYQVRCNMFHGEKEIDESQLALLQPCIRCLEKIMNEGLRKIAHAA